ncbi:MAG TPA: F0F1 ATP synthase subunit A [Candidatus Saccharimonadales bacterium]|nr:F0F1 ATP synthase subunit A [Candidatus Saccharimonadales bacterium]
MRVFRIILAVALLAWLPLIAKAAVTELRAPTAAETAQVEKAAAHAEHGEEGVPLKPVEIGHIGSFPITNSMVVTWVVALGIIIFAQIATRNIKQVPEGAQNFWEFLVEGLYKFLENIIGHALVKKTFWFFATIFIFILFCNWAGLIPGVGTVGWGTRDATGFHLTHPWFRGANADLNMTFAMSAVFFACWIVWALQANGVGGFLGHIFGAKGNTTGALKLLMVVVFFLVGILEVVSILFRPISLSFRLFGNVYAGESMLEAMSNLVPSLAWLIPIPFYFLEILVGLVQALVFMLLTAVFTLLITQHDESHDKAHHH